MDRIRRKPALRCEGLERQRRLLPDRPAPQAPTAQDPRPAFRINRRWDRMGPPASVALRKRDSAKSCEVNVRDSGRTLTGAAPMAQNWEIMGEFGIRSQNTIFSVHLAKYEGLALELAIPSTQDAAFCNHQTPDLPMRPHFLVDFPCDPMASLHHCDERHEKVSRGGSRPRTRRQGRRHTGKPLSSNKPDPARERADISPRWHA